MKVTLDVTGAAERNWPETVLICVRKAMFSVFQSIPNKESGTLAPIEGLQNLTYVPSLSIFFC